MSDRRGIFSLEEFYDLQVSGETSTISDTFIYVTSVHPAQTAGPAMGYWAGGNGSVVDRVDFSNDTPTASARGNLSVSTRSGLGNGGSTPSYGYAFAGSPGPKSSVDRIDYSNDSATASPKGPLSYARSQHSTITNTNYGYTGGGWPGPYSTIDRLDYANDTATATSLGNIMVPSGRDYATTGNQSYGYLLGGYDPSLPQYRSTVRRIDYSNDTATTSPRGSLRDICGDNSATGNANYGFIKGGGNATRGPIEVLDFANDTATPATTTSNILTVGAYNRGATGNADYGWFGGGDPPNRSYVDRIDYSNYTAAAVTKGPLTVARGSMATFSAREHGLPQTTSTKNFTPATRTETHNPQGTDYGYNGGGYTPAAPNRISLVDRIDYSNDTATAAVKGPLSVGRNGVSGTSNVNYGYMAGGIRNSPTGDVTLVDRIDYGNDTATASPKGNLSATRLNGCPVGNNNYGYIAGGRAGGTNNSTSIDRIDYSSDTSTALVKGPTTVGDSFYQAGTGNQSSGYITSGKSNGGGTTQGTTIQKIDYSNDTATASPKGNLEHAMSRTAAAGNSNYGYVGGGQDSSSRTYMQRIDYSSDTGTTSPKGPLVLAKYVHSAASSTTHGYFSAGKSPSAPGTGWSNTDRIDYSNDTATAVDKSPLSAARAYHAGTSSRDYGNPTGVQTVDKGAAGYTTSTPSPAYGYWSGGQTGSTPKSTVDRIDYSNDSANMVSKGPLSESGYYFVGISSPAYGYTCGSLYPSYKSTVQRADYANDTATAVVKGPLSRSDGSGSGLNSRSYGYVAGGQNPGNNSYVDRIDFSNDSATASPKGNLDTGRGKCAGTSNQNYGWATGGIEPGTSKVSRIDFSNDTSTSSPKGNMNVARMGHSGSGNADYGYQAGGNNNFNSSVDRIDYSNDTSTASPKGNTADAGIFHQAGTGNQSFGYIAGGSSTTVGTTVQRVEYSNDTATATPKGPLANQIARTASTGNGDFGYIAAGSDGPYMRTYVQRIDYSSDTSTTSPKGPVTLGRYVHSATSSTTHGYFTGGKSPSENTGTGWTTTDRIDYSNDTATAVNKSPLSAGRTYTTSTSSRNYANPTTVTKTVDFGAIGYLKTSPGGSGVPSPSYAYVIGGEGQPGPLPYANPAQRIDVTNDTAIAVAKAGAAPPTDRLYYSCSVGNRDYAWTSMGANYSNVQRMDYANDSAQMVNRCNRQPGMQLGYNEIAVGNENYGYFNGGYILYTIPGCGSPQGATNLSYINRMTYASDTTNTVLRSYNSNRAGMGGACGNNDYGYWLGAANGICGGYNGSSSWIERTDYANDTTNSTPKGNLSASVYANRGQGNKDYGWSNGGQYNRTRVERITYANDTATASPKGNLPVPHGNHQSTGTQSLGYVAGGNQPSSGTRIDRIDYSNDTAAASPKGNLVWIAYYGGGASASENGLTAVPPPPPVTSYIPRMRYVDSLLEGTGSTQPAPTQYGYFAGGLVAGQGTGVTTVDRLDFASDTTTASVRGSLNIQRNQGDGAGNMTHGYVFGGRDNTTVVSSTERVDYANDTATASAKGNLAVISYFHATVGNNDFAYTGNHYPQNTGQIGKFDYSNDTAIEVQFAPYTFTPSSYGYGACGNRNYGYFAGGSYQTHVRRVDYANDNTVASPRGPLSAGSLYSAAVGNADYGYVTISPNWYQHSRVTRIDYSNDTPTTVAKASLVNQNRTYRSAMGDNDYGYFTDGYLYSPQTAYSTLYRIDYASDSTIASPKGPLATTVYSSQGFSGRENGNPQAALPGLTGIQAPFQRPFPFPVQLVEPGPAFAYFAGGSPGPNWNAFSGIDRIQYSNDTATASPKGALTASKYAMSGCGTKEYGYIGAGGQQPGPDFSTTDRIDYSNDTATALARGVLNRAARSTAAASNTTYGYWAGGTTPYPTPTSKVSRLTFASDTAVQVAKGNLTTVRRRWHATGNQSYGYFAGGSPGGTRIDRIDYTNDTPTAASKGPLSVTRSGHAASGNASFGYFINGFAPGTSTSVDRLDYSSDTTTASPKGPLTSARAYNTGTGSPNFGYVAGGWTPSGQISYTDRIEYSNDTATSSPKGTLNSNPYRNASVSSQAYGLPG